MNRRAFLEMGAAGLFLQAARPVPGAAVDTASGRVRGLLHDGVHTFKGIPYGASTAGTARFLPPSKPQPWTAVRDAFEYGPRAPQPFRPMIPEIGDALTG